MIPSGYIPKDVTGSNIWDYEKAPIYHIQLKIAVRILPHKLSKKVWHDSFYDKIHKNHDGKTSKHQYYVITASSTMCGRIQNYPKVQVQQSKLLLRILEVVALNTDPETSYPEECYGFLNSLQANSENNLNSSTTRFLPNTFQFIML